MIRVALGPGAILPKRHSTEAAGLDLHYVGPDRIIWPAFKPVLLHTGVHIELPPGYGAFVLPRSSVTKRGIYVTIGTIDADYRGAIGVMVSTRWPRRVRNGERIAQLVPFYQGTSIIVQSITLAELNSTARGEKGFGSTGA